LGGALGGLSKSFGASSFGKAMSSLSSMKADDGGGGGGGNNKKNKSPNPDNKEKANANTDADNAGGNNGSPDTKKQSVNDDKKRAQDDRRRGVFAGKNKIKNAAAKFKPPGGKV